MTPGTDDWLKCHADKISISADCNRVHTITWGCTLHTRHAYNSDKRCNFPALGIDEARARELQKRPIFASAYDLDEAIEKAVRIGKLRIELLGE
jgi:hypothetical protein